MNCQLCRKATADTAYEVERANPKMICSSCFGRWAPKELDSLLGVKPDYSHRPMTRPAPVASAVVLSEAAAGSRSRASELSPPGGPEIVPSGPPTNSKGETDAVDEGDPFDHRHRAGGDLVVK